METMNMATRLPVFKLDRRKLLTVAMNMAAIVRLENPRRLSNFEGSGLDKKSGKQEEEIQHEDDDRCSKEDKKHSCYRTCG